MDLIITEALAELIAAAVSSAAGHAWASVKRNPEGRAIKAAIVEALCSAMRDSALPVGTSVDDAWVDDVARVWMPAFTPNVSWHLVASVADAPDDGARRFAEFAKRALVAGGCDLASLGQTFWVDEFLVVLPRRFFDSLNEASLRDPAVRGLVDHILRRRTDARARRVEPATPGQFRQDLITMLRGLDEQARTGRLPPYLPAGADVAALSRAVRVKRGARSGLADRPVSRGSAVIYRLPVDRSEGDEPAQPWREVADNYRRLVVLADPGLGKSWLIRTETHRLCQEALASFPHDLSLLTFPMPARCDQLVAAAGDDLATKAAEHLVSQGLLHERSRSGLAAKLRAGEAVVLLDALDELTPAESGSLRELVRSWADECGDSARCVITSRIAGYTGPPLPGAQEVELQAFTNDDVVEAMTAWEVSPQVADRLRNRLGDPAIAEMARIPLLLALLCSLAAQLPDGEALPRTRGRLYERVLRWFLTGAHRSPDDPDAPALDDLEVETLLEILAPLACAFATQPEGWTDLMPRQSLLNVIRSVGAPFTELHRAASEVVRDLSVGAGVLVPEGDPSAGRSPRYLFLHRTIAEYLTARHLATLPKADWLSIVDQHRWFDPDWTEVLPMLGEQLSPDAGQDLIRHFLNVRSDPFQHSFFTATRVWGVRADAE